VPAKRDHVLSGWRAGRLVQTGGLIVRDGAAFRIHQWADERSRRCGRVPSHVVDRLKAARLLEPFRGDPDRLVHAGDDPQGLPKPVAMPPALTGNAPVRVLDRLDHGAGALGVRLRAAAGRFRADYQLAASPGRLRNETPQALAAARTRLLAVENALGPDKASMVEMLVLDRFTVPALQHRAGAGLEEARDVMVELGAVYGLVDPGQEAGKAFASS